MQDLKLGGPFSNHLVLQRDRENPSWGCDLPGQRIVSTIDGPKGRLGDVSVIANSEGRWFVWLPVLPVGGPHRIRIVGSSALTLGDVLVGDVWLASGQSNMEWRLAQTDRADEEIAVARYNAIRM